MRLRTADQLCTALFLNSRKPLFWRLGVRLRPTDLPRLILRFGDLQNPRLLLKQARIFKTADADCDQAADGEASGSRLRNGEAHLKLSVGKHCVGLVRRKKLTGFGSHRERRKRQASGGSGRAAADHAGLFLDRLKHRSRAPSKENANKRTAFGSHAGR